MSERHSIDSLSDEAFGWYFSGFADGESHFGLVRWTDRRKDRSTNVLYKARFEIRLRADDSVTLIAVAKRMKCGNIHFRTPKTLAGRKPTNPDISWRVQRISDLATILVPHFEKFPLQFKKAKEFPLWREAVLFCHKMSLRPPRGRGQIITPEERTFVANLASQLRVMRQYDPAPIDPGILERKPMGRPTGWTRPNPDTNDERK